MKKTLAIIFCLALVFVSSLAFAAGTVTVTRNSVVPKFVEQIIFTCVGDVAGATAGSIPNTAFTQQDLRYVQGMYLYAVTAYPVSGGTAPDAADVFILTPNNEDLLGSTDNTTAGNGLNLIHASLQKTCIPKLGAVSVNFYPVVSEILTLKVLNQGTAEADWVIVLTFVK